MSILLKILQKLVYGLYLHLYLLTAIELLLTVGDADIQKCNFLNLSQ